MSNPPDAGGLAPSLDDLAALAEQAFAALPDAFRQMTGDVIFPVGARCSTRSPRPR